jgi:murein DD-endopeptidase MepM/ murein hydrolase activator NlpD
VPGFVSCSVFGDSSASAYTLPFEPGRRFKVTRTFGHYTPLNEGVGLYALDIDMPMRTPVLAIRSGVVVAVEQRYSDDDHAVYHENWVMVRHADGTVARYIHLAQNGARAAIGDTVTQGQVVGLSGNSGDSSGPHLHFDVQTCGPNLPPAYNRQPCGMTVPLSFRNTAPHACGLVAGSSYTALQFQPGAN